MGGDFFFNFRHYSNSKMTNDLSFGLLSIRVSCDNDALLWLLTGVPKYDCEILRNTTILHRDKCKSVGPVELTSCLGSCGASSAM